MSVASARSRGLVAALLAPPLAALVLAAVATPRDLHLHVDASGVHLHSHAQLGPHLHGPCAAVAPDPAATPEDRTALCLSLAPPRGPGVASARAQPEVRIESDLPPPDKNAPPLPGSSPARSSTFAFAGAFAAFQTHVPRLVPPAPSARPTHTPAATSAGTAELLRHPVPRGPPLLDRSV